MKRDILGIIEKNKVMAPFGDSLHMDEFEQTAKEIAFHITQFIEWLKENSDIEYDHDNDKYVWLNYYLNSTITHLQKMSTEEMYQFWEKNIHKTKPE